MLELELLLGVLLAPELGVALDPLVEPEEAPLLGVELGEVLEDEDALPLGVVLGAALDEEELLGAVLGEVEEELEPELGVVTLPEAEPLAEPG